MTESKSRLKEILKKKSVIVGREFTLSSGRKSDFYVDARITTLDAEGSYLCGKIFLNMIKSFPKIDSVGGYSIGADPIVTAVALCSHIEKNNINAFIIRKEAKKHGTAKSIEGNFKEGDNVIIFDDVVTSGGSILKGAKEVEHQGGKVLAIMSVIDREEGGREIIEKEGYKFFSIFTQKNLRE